ncbi:unnamed protein product [Meganyctiphanes norvegica]|uniref:P-type ATPase A domain-containing protein n=1 Tax=Meganyctiphanes norvegica TaxID=48144 RepID=A0AAV2QUR6_MEGNR
MGGMSSHSIERIREEHGIREHTIPIEELYEKFGVDPDVGHTIEDAHARYEEDGPNKLCPHEDPRISYPTDYTCLVLREGEKHTILVEELVLGDIVEMNEGDVVPADIRIIEAENFMVNVCEFTMEIEPKVKSPNCTSENPIESENLCFMSTVVVEGWSKGIVYAIGDNTLAGQLLPHRTIEGE